MVSGHTEQLIRDHCLAPERADAPVYGGRYRRMFEDLPAREEARFGLADILAPRVSDRDEPARMPA